MELEKVKTEVAKRLPNERYEHVQRVAETAQVLAEKYSVPLELAEQAAWFHDIAKCMAKSELNSMMQKESVDQRLFSFHPELWHAPVGVIIARDEFGVTNTDVLNAIRYHTTGRAKMSKLEKLIFIADMIEPGRNFPGVNRLRDAAEQHLDIGMATCIHHSVQFLIGKKVPVFPDSIDCYNEYVSQSIL